MSTISLEPVPGRTDEMVVNMGPQHPATHGVLRVVIGLEGERIVRAVPHIGYLHRNHEKIEEARTFWQVIPYTDRMDYVSGTQNELPVILAVEDLLGIEVPDRAKQIRTIFFELFRIASHLVWMGTAMLDLGAITPFLYTFWDREIILGIVEKTAGARMLPNYYTLGGVRRDVHPDFFKDVADFVDHLERRMPDYEHLVLENPIVHARTKGVGVLSKERAIARGVSGPVLRASGVAYDVRKAFPYDAYPEVEFEIPTSPDGDTYARFWVRFQEIYQACKIIRQLLEKTPKTGPYKGKAPARLKVNGERYRAVENSRGELGVYVVGDGTDKPYRIKHRGAAFGNLQVIPDLFIGAKFSDAIAILSSLDPVFGEIDR
ncbi:NADH-quinone oxidoreductase subunit D [Oceanithermus sp.]